MTSRAKRIVVSAVAAPVLLISTVALLTGAPAGARSTKQIAPVTLWATGDDSYGQLGTGAIGAGSNVPVAVALPDHATITQADAGTYHTLALTDAGTVFAWGRGASGALGDGSTADSATPVRVPLPDGVTATEVAAGDGFSLALTASGQVYSWGDDTYGQVGNGTTNSSGYANPQPVSFPSGITITDISAGEDFALARAANGAVYAWGDNSTGQLGDYSVTTRTTPVLVSVPAGVTATKVAAGGSSGYALTSSGSILAWGAGQAGQLGDGFGLTSIAPVYVHLPSGVTATSITAGGGFADAVANGVVYAWGGGNFDDLGNGGTASQLTPITIPFPAGTSVVAASGGSGFGFALDSTGAAWSWGLNSYGQLGDGSTATGPTPVHIALPSGYGLSDVSAGGQHAVLVVQARPTVTSVSPGIGSATGGTAVTITGTHFTDTSTVFFGRKAATITARNSTSITATAPAHALGYVDVTVRNAGGTSPLVPADRFAAVSSRTTIGWGYVLPGALGDGVGTSEQLLSPVPVYGLRSYGFTKYAAGAVASYGLTAAGRVYAWGDDTYGELGDGGSTTSAVPVPVALPAGVVVTSIVAGDANGYALTTTGQVYAWGYNTYGAVGIGTLTFSSTPALVHLPAGVKATQVAAGRAFAVVRTNTGALYAWGYNSYGQLGNGSTRTEPTPVAVRLPAGTSVTQIAAGFDHVLALTTTGIVLAWGDNNYGQLGNGTQLARHVPVRTRVPAGTTVRQLAGNYAYSVAVTATGAVLAWGDNGNGQLGDGTTTNRSTPVVTQLPPGVAITQLAAGDYQVEALASTGALYAWGSNAQGELGDGTTAQRTSPIRVPIPSDLAITQISGRGLFSLAVLRSTV